MPSFRRASCCVLAGHPRPRDWPSCRAWSSDSIPWGGGGRWRSGDDTAALLTATPLWLNNDDWWRLVGWVGGGNRAGVGANSALLLLLSGQPHWVRVGDGVERCSAGHGGNLRNNDIYRTFVGSDALRMQQGSATVHSAHCCVCVGALRFHRIIREPGCSMRFV